MHIGTILIVINIVFLLAFCVILVYLVFFADKGIEKIYKI